MPLQAIVRDIYDPTNFSELVLRSFEPDFEAIDANREMICKIELVVEKYFYQKKAGGDPHLRPSGLKSTKYLRRMPDACTKEEARKYICSRIEDCWRAIPEEIEEYREKGRLRACLGKVTLSVSAKENENAGISSLATYRVVPYEIYTNGARKL